MPDTGLRAKIRKDLRDYDNPKRGRNKNYLNMDYMMQLVIKYDLTEADMRMYATSRKKRNLK